jgi:hypothetical protein
MSMTKEQKYELYLSAIKRINPIEFYDSKDAEFTGNRDGVDAVAIVRFPGYGERKIAINEKTGEWKDLSPEGTIQDELGLDRWLTMLDYIELKYMQARPPDRRKDYALQSLCEFAHMNDALEVTRLLEVPRGEIDKLQAALPKSNIETLKRTQGVNAETLGRYMVGWWKGQYTIPVPDIDGRVLAIRYAKPYTNFRWMNVLASVGKLESSPRCFGLDELVRGKWHHVLVVETEWTRMLLQQELPDDWGSVLPIGEFQGDWLSHFEDKFVVLLPETPIGLQTMRRATGPMIERAKPCTLKLLDTMEWRPWLINRTVAEFLSKISDAPNYALPTEDADVEPLILKRLQQIEDPANTDKRVQVPLAIACELSTAFASPSKFKIAYCPKIKSGECSICLEKEFSIPPGDVAHIDSCGANDQKIKTLLSRRACKYGARCQPEVVEKATYRECLIKQHHNQMIVRDDGRPDMVQIDGQYEKEAAYKAYIKVPDTSCESFKPRGYKATGWIRTHPGNSMQTLVVEHIDPIPEPYEHFTMDAANEWRLNHLSSLGWENIVKDLIEHRTRIYDRPDLMLVTLLTYVSPLHLQFNGEMIRGWLTAAVVGDTAVGKSRTFEVLSGLVGFGDIFSCQTGKRTGLSHAMLKGEGGEWRVQPGMQPMNTRKILCVEEAQALEHEEVRSLAESMERGVLSVRKAGAGTFETKTRMIFNANPLGDRPLDTYPYGILALRDLFTPPFIRRLDIAMCIRRTETNEAGFNREPSEEESQVHPEHLRTLIVWAWNLRPDQVVFDREVTNAILDAATGLASRFGQSDDIPLCLATVARFTLARIAAAFAVLDVSGFPAVTVKIKHVDAARAFLTRLYTNPDCGLDRWSFEARRRVALDDYDLLLNQFLARLELKNPESVEGNNKFAFVVNALRRGDECDVRGYAEMLSLRTDVVDEIVSTLMGMGLVRKTAGTVSITPRFTRFLERLEKENVLAIGVLDAAAGKMGK